MHNYNEHITPSPFVPYPQCLRPSAAPPSALTKSPSQADNTIEQKEEVKDKESMPAPAITKRIVDGPRIYTTVLHPTDLSRHHDMLILAKTPLADLRGNRNGSVSRDGQPPTPMTPSITRATLNEKQPMALEQQDLYAIEAEMLLHQNPVLLLDPAHNAEEAQMMADMLRHPLHSHPPPSPQTRKRTHAEMAAEDANDAERERRMLLMDERVRPSQRGGGERSAADGQGASSTLDYSRFKTLATIRQQHEEKDRLKKEEEVRTALAKRENDLQQAQRKKLLEDKQLQEAQMKMRQQAALQQQQQMLAQSQAQHANNMPTNAQQQQLQQQAQLAHLSSPVVRQQTPMMASSPMLANSNGLPNGGFAMTASASNQGAGSPPQPASAMQHPGVAMARQMSQQHSQSRHNTPQMLGTPSMASAVPMDSSRQMTATPRMAHGSPVQAMQAMQGTPNQGMMNTPQMNQQHLTPQQQQMIMQRQRQQQLQAQAMQAGQGQMTPEQMMRQQQQLAMQQQQQQQLNPQAYQAQLMRMQQMQLQQQAAQNQVGTPQMQPGMAQGNIPNDPQMMQQRQQQLRAQQQMLQQRNTQMIQHMAAQNGGQVPQQIRQQLHQQQQQQLQQRNLHQQQVAAMRAQQQHLGDPNNTEQYMQNLRNQQALLANLQKRGQQAMTPGQQQQFNGMTQAMQQQMQAQAQTQMRSQQQAAANNGALSHEFAAMQNALNQQQQGHQQQRPGTGMG